MKRVIRILLCIGAFGILSACSKATAPPGPTVFYPDAKTEQTVDGYRAESESETVIYYVNRNTKKFHLPDCPYVSKTKETNLMLCDNEEELLNNGYTPCPKCLADS